MFNYPSDKLKFNREKPDFPESSYLYVSGCQAFVAFITCEFHYASKYNLKLTFLLFIFAVLSSIGCNTISNVSFSHSFLSTYRYYVCEDSKALAKAVSVLFFSVENFLLFEYLFPDLALHSKQF